MFYFKTVKTTKENENIDLAGGINHPTCIKIIFSMNGKK
jgi:hypothetical protein